jgi:hypothetical protein
LDVNFLGKLIKRKEVVKAVIGRKCRIKLITGIKYITVGACGASMGLHALYTTEQAIMRKEEMIYAPRCGLFRLP